MSRGVLAGVRILPAEMGEAIGDCATLCTGIYGQARDRKPNEKPDNT